MSNESLSYLTNFFYKKSEEIKQKEVIELRNYFIENISSSILIFFI
jgi:hypothetical protein